MTRFGEAGREDIENSNWTVDVWLGGNQAPRNKRPELGERSGSISVLELSEASEELRREREVVAEIQDRAEYVARRTLKQLQADGCRGKEREEDAQHRGRNAADQEMIVAH